MTVSVPPLGAPGEPLLKQLPAVLLVAAGVPYVGSTTTAGLVALSAYDAGASVLLVDAAGDWGRTHGISPVARLFGAGAAVQPMTHLPLAARFALWCGGADPAAFSRESRELVLDASGEYDVVIVDGGWQLDTIRWAAEVASALALALTARPHDPAILLLTGESRNAVAASYAAAKVIRQVLTETGLAARGPVPMAATTARLERAGAAVASRRLVEACAALLGVEVHALAGVPDDPVLPRAIGSGMSIADSIDGSPTRAAAAQLASALLPIGVPVTA